MVDKYHFIKGGAERYLFELSNILEAHGHEVVPFSMKHPRNFRTPYESFFVENLDYDLDTLRQRVMRSPVVFSRMVYSRQARARIEALIRKTEPDIAHLHMIDHQLSPSILPVLKKYKIPVIQTIHQYKLVCPNYRLYNMRTKQICEKCLGGSTMHPIFERCHKDSALAGLMIALESGIHRRMRIYEKHVDLFHVPSRFMGEKMKQGGFDSDKIEHLFYTIQVDRYTPNYDGEDYFLYYGRLATEKGIMTLLKAVRRLNRGRLLIAGEGPQRSELEGYAEDHGLKRVKFLGYKDGEALKELVERSQFVVLPSEWYDNSPLVIYEAAAQGKPVIASDIGGIPELIDDRETGLLFPPGDDAALAVKLDALIGRRRRLNLMGRKAREKAEKEFSPAVHYPSIMAFYKRLMNPSVSSQQDSG